MATFDYQIYNKSSSEVRLPAPFNKVLGANKSVVVTVPDIQTIESNPNIRSLVTRGIIGFSNLGLTQKPIAEPTPSTNVIGTQNNSQVPLQPSKPVTSTQQTQTTITSTGSVAYQLINNTTSELLIPAPFNKVIGANKSVVLVVASASEVENNLNIKSLVSRGYLSIASTIVPQSINTNVGSESSSIGTPLSAEVPWQNNNTTSSTNTGNAAANNSGAAASTGVTNTSNGGTTTTYQIKNNTVSEVRIPAPVNMVIGATKYALVTVSDPKIIESNTVIQDYISKGILSIINQSASPVTPSVVVQPSANSMGGAPGLMGPPGPPGPQGTPGSNSIVTRNQGTLLGDTGTLNFVGSGINASYLNGVTTVSVAGAADTFLTGVDTSNLNSGDLGYIFDTVSGIPLIKKTSNGTTVESYLVGAYTGTQGTIIMSGIVNEANVTLDGGKPANGSAVFLANKNDDGGTGAGKITATIPTTSGAMVVNLGIFLDNSNYDTNKKCKILLRTPTYIKRG